MVSGFRITPPEFQEGRRAVEEHIQQLVGCQRQPPPLRKHGALRTDDLQAEGGMDPVINGSRVWEGDSRA